MTQRSGKWCYPREGVYMGTGSLGDWYAVNLANKPGTNHIKELQSDHKSKGYHRSMGCDDPKKVGDQVRSLDLTKVRRATTRPRGEIYRKKMVNEQTHLRKNLPSHAKTFQGPESAQEYRTQECRIIQHFKKVFFYSRYFFNRPISYSLSVFSPKKYFT